MTPYEQALGKSGKENSLLRGRYLEQNQGAAICREHLVVMGGRQDKIYTESENLPSYIFCDINRTKTVCQELHCMVSMAKQHL